MDNLPVSSVQPTARAGLVERIAFWFWFAVGSKVFVTFLFFQSAPANGMLVAGALACAFAFVVAVLRLGTRSASERRPRLGAMRIISLFLIWTGLTIFWTYAASLIVALSYWAITSLEVLTTLMLLQMGPVDKVARKSLQGVVFAGLAVGLVALLFGNYDFFGRLGHEEFMHPNMVGNQMAIGALISIYLGLGTGGDKRTKVAWLVVATFFAGVLVASGSKTAMLGLVLAATVYVGFTRIARAKKLAIICMFVLVASLSSDTLTGYMDQYLHVQQGGYALETVSGRTLIWQGTWEMIKANPVVGYGFMSFRDYGPQVIKFRLVHAHNELLQVWFSYGLVGVVLVLYLYGSFLREVLRNLKRRTEKPEVTLALAILVYFLVRGLNEGSVYDLVFPAALILLFWTWIARPVDAQPSSSAYRA